MYSIEVIKAMNEKACEKAGQYTREQLLDVMASYIRMIEHDNGKYPTVVLDDIKCSITAVLKANGR